MQLGADNNGCDVYVDLEAIGALEIGGPITQRDSGFKEFFRGEGQPTASALDATVAPAAIQRQHSCFAFGRFVVALYGSFGNRQRVR